MTASLSARIVRAAGGAALAAALAGCVSLLPKTRVVQMYRFGASAASDAPRAADPNPKVGVLLAPIAFQRAAAGDQMLTVSGARAAYIGGARWLSPAEVLFEEAAGRAFETSARVRLLGRGEFAAAQASLRLDVPVFEVRYGPAGAAPSVRVEVRAVLAHRAGGDAAARTFTADAPAAEDRVGAIVAAYDAAVSQVDAALVAWTDANADLAAGPAPPAAAEFAAPVRPIPPPGRRRP